MTDDASTGVRGGDADRGPARPAPGSGHDSAAERAPAPAVTGTGVTGTGTGGSDADAVAGAEQAAGSDDAGRPADGQPQPDFRTALLQSIGGWRGMVDSGLPVVVFVVANVAGGLRAAIWSAVAAAAVLTGIRLVRRQSVQQAVSGFFGVALAAFVASRTGEAKGYFLLGIWASFVYAGLFLLSVLVRRPAVGLIWEYVDSGGDAWRRDRALMRVYTWTSLVWTAVFLSRGLVQRFLYDEDRTGWLAVARLAMGYPLTLAALAVTLLAVRHVRAHRRPAGDTTAS